MKDREPLGARDQDPEERREGHDREQRPESDDVDELPHQAELDRGDEQDQSEHTAHEGSVLAPVAWRR